MVHLAAEVFGNQLSLSVRWWNWKKNVSNIVAMFSATTSAQMWTKFSHSEDGGSRFFRNVRAFICYADWNPEAHQKFIYDSVFPKRFTIFCPLINQYSGHYRNRKCKIIFRDVNNLKNFRAIEGAPNIGVPFLTSRWVNPINFTDVINRQKWIQTNNLTL